MVLRVFLAYCSVRIYATDALTCSPCTRTRTTTWHWGKNRHAFGHVHFKFRPLLRRESCGSNLGGQGGNYLMPRMFQPGGRGPVCYLSRSATHGADHLRSGGTGRSNGGGTYPRLPWPLSRTAWSPGSA